MKQKMFKCEKCGLIEQVVAYASYGTYDIYVSYDENGREIEECLNHDADEVDGWFCSECGSFVNKNDVIEVDINET